MALSALHLVHGELPSHLDFFRRHRSQALPTRFLRMSESDEDILWAATALGIVCVFDVLLVEMLSVKDQVQSNISGLCLYFNKRVSWRGLTAGVSARGDVAAIRIYK